MEVEITSNNFEEEVIKSSIPVLVDFWATWCGPCKMLSPLLKELAEENLNKIKVCKVNVDENREIANNFDIVSIPILLLFKNGKVVRSSSGYISKNELEKFIKE